MPLWTTPEGRSELRKTLMDIVCALPEADNETLKLDVQAVVGIALYLCDLLDGKAPRPRLQIVKGGPDNAA